MKKERVSDFSFLRKKEEKIEGFKFGKWSVLLLILAIVFIGLAVKLTFFYTEECGTLECFQSAMRECDKVRYINDAEEATWNYEILGLKNDKCVIEVTLLQAKEGQLNVDSLQGYEMVCEYEKGVVNYPERNLENCHGRLKEELQEIIIENLHKYMIENLKNISKELK